MSSDIRSWKDLLFSRDPIFLREAAELAEQLGRDMLAEALRESAADCEEIDESRNS